MSQKTYLNYFIFPKNNGKLLKARKRGSVSPTLTTVTQFPQLTLATRSER